MLPTSEQILTARLHARRFRRGVMRAGEDKFECAFVIDGRDASIVLPAPEAIDLVDDLVLYVPDDGFNEMALLVSAAPHLEALDESRDRYLAYHGRSEWACWARCRVDSAKWGGVIYEGAALLDPNRLASAEPALCKRLNADRETLATLTAMMTRVRPESPLCVGVDHLGMDVRTKVGIIRVEWPAEIRSVEEAGGVIDALLKGAA